MKKFTILKTTAFKAKEQDHTHYTLAYKGRVISVNTLRFPTEQLKVEGTTLEVSGDVSLVKRIESDLDGTSKTYLDLMPKMDISVDDF